ncbi:MAG: hypothetical protein AAFX99_28995, partial [Myxococcota bacterium]
MFIDTRPILQLVRVSAMVALLVCVAAPTIFAEPKAPAKLDTSQTTAQTFRYKYKANQARNFGLDVTQELTMEPLSQDAPMPPMTTKSNVKALMNVTTQKILPDGLATIETRYQDFNLTLNNNGVEMGKAQLKTFEDMLKRMRSTSKMNPRGETKDFQYEGIDPSLKQMTDSMKSVTKGLTPIFPKKALKIGEDWTVKETVPVAQGPVKLSLKFNITYTFLGYTSIGQRHVDLAAKHSHTTL